MSKESQARRPRLSLAFLSQAPASAAEVLENLNAADAAAFLDDVPGRLAMPVVSCMSPWSGARCLELLSPHRAASILRRMAFHDAAGLLRLIPGEQHDALLAELPTRLARRLQNALRYPAGSVGAWLDPDVPGFSTDATVRDARRYLRHGSGASHIFVHRPDTGRFVGAVPAAAVLRGDAATPLAQLPAIAIEPLSSRASLASVSAHEGWDDFLVLPVVGHSRALVGGLSRASLRRGQQARRATLRTAPGTVPGQLLTALGITFAGLWRLLVAGEIHAGADSRQEQTRG